MNTANNTTAALRDHIILLGKELEFASGIRALAAERIMLEQGISDTDELFSACGDLIGAANLFESYDDALNTRPTGFVLGQGCPFPSLDAYIELAEMYGDDWLKIAMTDYVAHYRSTEMPSKPYGEAVEMIDGAQARFCEALLFKIGIDVDESLRAMSSRLKTALSMVRQLAI